MRRGWTTTPFSHFLTPVRRKAVIDPGETYKMVTLPLYGKGARLRKECLGSELGTSKFEVRTGDLMISKIDARKGSNSLLPPELDGAIVTADFLSYIVDESVIDKAFFDIIVRSPLFAELCDTVSAGSTNRVRLEVSRFLDLTIDLPPLDQQQRIVDLIGSLDDAIRAADSLSVNMAGCLGAVSEEAIFGFNWATLTVAELAEQPRGLIGGPFGSSLVSKDYTAAGVPVIRGTNMPARDKYVGGDFAFVSTEKAGELKRNIALQGDVIFTQRGTLGQIGLVPHSGFPEYVISQSQMRLRPNPDKVLAEYVYYAFRTPRMTALVKGRNSATANPHINLGILAGLSIPVPPISEQERLIDLFDSISDVASLAGRNHSTLKDARSEILSVLLSGEHEIPESYDIDTAVQLEPAA